MKNTTDDLTITKARLILSVWANVESGHWPTWDIQSLTGLNSIASARLSRLGEKNYVGIHCALNELLSFEGMYVLEKIGMYLLAGSDPVELPDMESVEWNTLKYLEMQQWLTKLRVDVQRRLKEAESDRKDNPDAYIWDRR